MMETFILGGHYFTELQMKSTVVLTAMLIWGRHGYYQGAG